MKGWKTWLAVGGLCVLGVYLIQTGDKEFGMMCIFNGLGLVGIGSKVDRVSK